MPKGRKPTAKAYDLDVIEVFLVATPDLSADSVKRTKEAQQIIAKMMVSAQKRGRPKKEEVMYEEAA
jgi:hypothetical protein